MSIEEKRFCDTKIGLGCHLGIRPDRAINTNNASSGLDEACIVRGSLERLDIDVQRVLERLGPEDLRRLHSP